MRVNVLDEGLFSQERGFKISLYTALVSFSLNSNQIESCLENLVASG